MKKDFSFVVLCPDDVSRRLCRGITNRRPPTRRTANPVVKPKKFFPLALAAAVGGTNDISITGYFMNQPKEGLDATALASALVGQGVQISNVTSSCADRSCRRFFGKW